jgi:hypothetical protein
MVDLHGANLSNANLSCANLHSSNLQGVNLSNASLSHAHLFCANLQGANLRGANLLWAGLAGTDLQDADLTGADLTRASLLRPDRHVPTEWLGELTPERRRETGFVCPNMTGADLTGANLVGADLLDPDLTGATLTSVRADVRTRWPEGFDPQQQGIEIPPFAAEWRLKRGEVVLGTLQNCRPDYRPPLPWFLGQFTPTLAFEEVQSFFDEAVRLRGTERREEYYRACKAIDALGLRLESLAGEILDPYSLYIEDEQARFRY